MKKRPPFVGTKLFFSDLIELKDINNLPEGVNGCEGGVYTDVELVPVHQERVGYVLLNSSHVDPDPVDPHLLTSWIKNRIQRKQLSNFTDRKLLVLKTTLYFISDVDPDPDSFRSVDPDPNPEV